MGQDNTDALLAEQNWFTENNEDVGFAIREPNYSHCNQVMNRNGKTKSGYQRYRCRCCGFSLSESGLKGRPTIGDRPMTRMELYLRHLDKKRLQGK